MVTKLWCKILQCSTCGRTSDLYNFSRMSVFLYFMVLARLIFQRVPSTLLMRLSVFTGYECGKGSFSRSPHTLGAACWCSCLIACCYHPPAFQQSAAGSSQLLMPCVERRAGAPEETTSAPSLTIFCHRLKTYSFSDSLILILSFASTLPLARPITV